MNNNEELNKGISYIEDILKEVAEEEGYDLGQVKEIWKKHRAYVKELMDDPDVHIIELPHLANLYFNANTANHIAREKNTKKETKSYMKEKAEDIENKIEEDKENNQSSTNYRYPQKSRGGIYKLYRNIVRTVLGEKLKGGGYRNNKFLSKLFEDYSNGKLKNEQT